MWLTKFLSTIVDVASTLKPMAYDPAKKYSKAGPGRRFTSLAA